MFFDATQIDPTDTYAAIPAGDYDVMVAESAIKPTKMGTGQYLELILQIQSGPHQGRKLWDRMTLQNPSAKAVEIGQRQLSQLCHAVGVLQVNSPDQLHYRPCLARVVAKSDAERGTVNEVKGYKAKAAQGPAFSAAPRVQAPTMQQQPALGGIYQPAPAYAPPGAQQPMQQQGAPLPWAA